MTLLPASDNTFVLS